MPGLHLLLSFTVIVLMSTNLSLAQETNLGILPVRNYAKNTYGGGTQNWEAASDRYNRIYWANNDGLLQFDGARWKVYPAGNRTIVRSVAIDPNDRIYIGAQSDFGYFEAGPTGNLVYTSLAEMLPNSEKAFEDVWDIAMQQDQVYFSTTRKIFQYTGDSLIVHTMPGDVAAMFTTPEGLMVHLNFETFLRFQDDRFVEAWQIPGLVCAITGVLSWLGDTILLTTLKQGLYYSVHGNTGKWITKHDDLLYEKRIYTSTLLPGNRIALGTSLDGLIVMDSQRRIYRHITKKDGLQNNNILHTFCDKAGNLWLGLNNGIDCIVMDSPLSMVFPDYDLKGTGYAAMLHDDKLYLGVSNGAYVAPWQEYYDPNTNTPFEPLARSEGQVWGFSEVHGKQLMGHHEGAFVVHPKEVTPLYDRQGVWTFLPLEGQYILAGHYHGLSLYRLENNNLGYIGSIEGIQESCRIMMRGHDNIIWISHPYRGLYRMQWTAEKPLQPEITFYNSSYGLPSDYNNYVFNINGNAIFGTEKGVYQFDRESDHFVPDPEFDRLLGSGHRVKYMREDENGHIWYITDVETGILHITDQGLKKAIRKEVIPELSGKLVGGFEMIYPIDNHLTLIGSEEGFLLYDRSRERSGDTSMQLVWGEIFAKDKSDSLLLFDPWQENTRATVLASRQNNFSFSYAATEYKWPELVRYRTQLVGVEDNWSTWNADTRRQFTRLSPGRYTFRVQAGIDDLRTSNILSFSFRIRPPWYASPIALAMYGLAIAGIFTAIVVRQRHRFESEKERLADTHREKEEKHLREVAASRAALTEMQNEKLEVEIKYKNQELALTTMHLVQKAELLLTVQKELNQIQVKAGTQEVKKDIRQLINLLNFDVKLDEDWEHFAHHFDQVHVNFLKTLRERFPQLSANDYKLCAYLRMNLSTKEIAPLMNISVRGVEGSRYRLRKKLNLPTDANLTEFILGLGA